MKRKTYIIATRDFTYIKFSIFPEMAIYFQRKYASTKTTTTISEKYAPDCGRPQYLLLRQRQSHLIIQSSKSNMQSVQKQKILIENHYEVCLILIKETFQFKFIPEMFSRLQEMNEAKLYASCHGLQARDATKVLSEYINRMSWKTGDRVLDLGCGTGSVTTQVLMPRLPADFGLLIGADISADMIQFANKNYAHSKLSFTQFDLAKNIDYTSQLRQSGFDKIFSFFCLHWIPDQRYYLAIKPVFHS
jgi:methylase of polypeptide subunit release factors